jgi:hypothetical protein
MTVSPSVTQKLSKLGCPGISCVSRSSVKVANLSDACFVCNFVQMGNSVQHSLLQSVRGERLGIWVRKLS